MGQGVGPHRALRLSGNGDFRSFEPEPCRWQMVIRDPPLGPIAQFSQATLIEENQPSHLATLQTEATRSRTGTPVEMISLAYKANNIRAITASPPPDWSVRRRLEYVRWTTGRGGWPERSQSTSGG